jgi:AcrR family transcriptional regulator
VARHITGTSGKTSGKTRSTYHHGDLTNALTDAAMQLARAGGPQAVVLREAARQVGVSATAAYRHFAGHEDLIHAVKERSQVSLAEAMRGEVASLTPTGDPGADAVAQLHAIGLGYIRFALAEPGLFRTAFCRTEHRDLETPPRDLTDFASFAMLGDILDDLVAAGRMPARRRAAAPFTAWSAVHGLATLILDGPLAVLPERARDDVITGTVDLVVEGLTTN